MRTKKPWQEKLTPPDLPKIVAVPATMKVAAGAQMVIPSPAELAELIRNTEKGEVVTTAELRERLAKKHKVDVACPLCTGIFVNMIANASVEEGNLASGAPYWRIVSPKGELNPKYPGGVDAQKQMLENEGVLFEGSKIKKPGTSPGF